MGDTPDPTTTSSDDSVSTDDNPARFFRYKDASNFYDLMGDKDA